MREALSILGHMTWNPDFEKMWNSGEIQEFISENPGNNYLSAHRALKAGKERRTRRFEAKVAKMNSNRMIRMKPGDEFEQSLHHCDQFCRQCSSEGPPEKICVNVIPAYGKILAIDDEPNIRRLIANEFSLEGFEVTTAKSGEEGIQLFDHGHHDVVLLDLELPGINGIETLKQLKHLSPGVAVIIVTGHGNIETVVETMKLGAHDFITKPFNLEELIALVKKASAIHRCMASCHVDIDDCRTRSGG